MNILITICARGGSKGVRNKNIRSLMGKPLIAYTIEQALKWGRASEVVVSTDSEDIADVAKKCGALVPFMRPEELAADDSPKIPSIRHAMLKCEEVYKKIYDSVVDLDPTAPIRSISDIESAYKKFIEHSPSTLFSVIKAHKNPYFNMVELDNLGKARLCKILPDGVCRRQDAPSVYSMNASIYVYRREYLANETNKYAYSDDSDVYIMDDFSGYDIDREVDFRFVEFLVKEKLVQL